MNDTLNTQFNLLEEVANRAADYPVDDDEAIHEAWINLGVALTVLYLLVGQEDVASGANQIAGIAQNMATKLNSLENRFG